MIGVPEADRERVVRPPTCSSPCSTPTSRATGRCSRCSAAALWTLTEFATELAKEREKSPQDDLMTALVQAEVDGDKLTHAEIAAFFVLLSVAGNDTSRHTTSHAMRALTVNPDQRDLLKRTSTGACRPRSRSSCAGRRRC